MSPELISNFRCGYLLGLPFSFIPTILYYIPVCPLIPIMHITQNIYKHKYIYTKYIKNMKQNTNSNLLITLLILTIITSIECFNDSICNMFWMQGVYYTLNTQYTSENKIQNNMIYNYCYQVEYYCNNTHKVVNGSLIKVYGTLGCYAYRQKNITLLDEKNISKGVAVNYQLVDKTVDERIDRNVRLTYQCMGSGAGCPDVEYSTIFSFFKDKQLAFAITIQIIGVIFMTLGFYIYRASIVLLGACTMFFILLVIQIPIIFYPGVPQNLVENILILTGICSFFAGYVFGYFPKLGIFMLGGWIGLIISLTMNNVAFYFIKTNPANLTLWIVMPILCVIFGVLSLFIKKAFIIFATSLIGAYMCLRALSWYLGAFPNQFLLSRKYHLGLTGPVTWKFYIYVIALIILTASSSALQRWLFEKKSEMNNQSKDVDEEFNNMEAKMKEQRQNLAQLGNFKQLFKKSKKRAPKVLKRQPSQKVDDQQLDEQQDVEEQLQEPSEQKPAISSKQLNKRFIIK